MNLPGNPYRAADMSDLSMFIVACCKTCRHMAHCTILGHAASYGGASEWRQVDEELVCIRKETE